jgi:hypothetical protein
LYGIGLFLLSGCVPRAEQVMNSPPIPFRVVLLPLAVSEVRVGETVEISMEIHNTTTLPVRYAFSGLTQFLFVNHYDEGTNIDIDNDLSNKQLTSGVRIYPTFYEESRGLAETTFPENAVERRKFKVIFSQTGTYLIQGALRVQLPSGIPNIFTTVIILSTQLPIFVKEKK